MNRQKLRKLTDNFSNILSNELHNISKKFNQWQIKNDISNLVVKTTFGCGGSYNATKNNPGIILRITGMQNEQDIIDTAKHEFIHILIEENIINKNHVPQLIKEAIVDIIGLELFDIPPQGKQIKLDFAAKYINIDTITENLSGAVEKMMTDYNTLMLNQKNKMLQDK
jgi:hypothetical protein